MPTLTLKIAPNQPALGLLPTAQVAYLLVTVAAEGAAGQRAVNWALVADASRSMRIPIVSEEQFRALLRNGGAQEVLIDGVPVWQLTGPVPPDVRAASPSALDFVARALHSVVDRLDRHDHFALVACAEEAIVLTRSTSGADQAALARGVARLPSLNLGEQTDLAHGIELGLNELRQGRAAAPDGARADRLLLLTDGFTQRPQECLRLAGEAAAAGVAITTIGLGGEFQEDVLTGLADRSAGQAVFLRKADDIPKAIASELSAARAVAARQIELRAALAAGVTLRRVTRIRPGLAILDQLIEPPSAGAPYRLPLGEIAIGTPQVLLLELMVPPQPAGPAQLGRLEAVGAEAAPVLAELRASYGGQVRATPPAVADAAARANAARLQARAIETAARGDKPEAARLLRAAAARLADLGEQALANLAQHQADALEQGGPSNPLATKELTYATRRLGEGSGQ
jgi:secreted protein with Ig-like and vWFA domain